MGEGARVYTIPLRDAYRAPWTKRAKVAVRLVREFVARHVKAQVVKVSPALNEVIWARGIRKPPRRVKVKVSLTEEDGVKVAVVEPAAEGGGTEGGG
ncbi:MAG: 50S ribosomal protein L31e [Thermofilum sp.]|jgi:large subunit ribosomal protein L31e|nr:50S ribosomal protein L31e [Thermofilum sp.]